MVTYNLTEEAYLTIFLHAAKYPSCTICGVLLAPQPGASSKASYTIEAAVPLFHLSMLLAPCVEVALNQVEAYAQQNKLCIIGYYHAEARFDATDIHPVAKRIAERIAERQPDACVVVLDNQKLAKFSREGSTAPPFDLLLRAADGPRVNWKKVPEGHTGSSLGLAGNSSWQQLQARFLNLHQAGLHANLADFDEHMDDIRQDYLNSDLFSRGTGVIKR